MWERKVRPLYDTLRVHLSRLSQHRFVEAYPQWSLMDRSLQLLFALALVVGVMTHAGYMLLPYLIWTPFQVMPHREEIYSSPFLSQVLVNMMMVASLVNLQDKTCLVIGFVLCMETFFWGVVYSAKQGMALDDLLDEKWGHLRVQSHELTRGVLGTLYTWPTWTKAAERGTRSFATSTKSAGQTVSIT